MVSWLHCQKIAGLEFQLLFNFTPVNVRLV